MNLLSFYLRGGLGDIPSIVESNLSGQGSRLVMAVVNAFDREEGYAGRI